METKHLKKYAPEARRDFIAAVKNKAAVYGLLPKEILPMKEEGDVVIIGDRPFPRSVAKQRKELEARIRKEGYQQFIEAIAYTWFNRFVAIRYMELHGYLDHGYRVLSHPEGKSAPEILENAERVELPGLKRDEVVDLKLDGGKDEQLYQMLLLAQCNALHKAMPFLFESIKDGTELLLPDNLLHTDSLVRTLVNDIPEEQWENVEIIGWLYQFYISEKKDEVIGKVVKSEDIPAATQLFTPNWIVRYMLHNTLGRKWLATYPDSPLKQQMEFYIEPAEQTAEVQQQLDEITPDSLNPEELTLLDPACGSGHILVEAYDLFKAIYEERGYRARDIPKLILTKNLFGLEIDDRAAQLSAFSLTMKARSDDRSLFGRDAMPNVVSIQESAGLDANEITEALNAPFASEKQVPSGELFEEIADEKTPLFSKHVFAPKGAINRNDINNLIELFEHGKTYGSLIQIPDVLAGKLPSLAKRVEEAMGDGGMFERAAANSIKPLIEYGCILSANYSFVLMNPPYLGSRKGMNALLKEFVKTHFPRTKHDLFAVFVERFADTLSPHGHAGIMTPFTWMFISTYEELRRILLFENTLESLIQPEYHAFFESAYVPICAFVFTKGHLPQNSVFIRLSDFYGEELQPVKTLEAIRDPSCSWRYTVPVEGFNDVPGATLAYWLPEAVRNVFRQAKPLASFGNPRQGMATSDNDRFLRLWYEVDTHQIGFACESREAASASGKKWFPYNKGGAYRKWYGNNEYVVNWENDGQELKEYAAELYGSPTRTIKNMAHYFKPCVTWTYTSSSYFGARRSDAGFVFDVSGSSAFPSTEWLDVMTGFLCSSLATELLRALNPTLSFQAGNLADLPFMDVEVRAVKSEIIGGVAELVSIARHDWDQSELSWDFSSNALVKNESETIVDALAAWIERAEGIRRTSSKLETENNLLFLTAYGLTKEYSSEVEDEQITLYVPERDEEVKRLISYAIGCMMGRYSLDTSGLTYASSGNNGFTPSRYTTFPPDEDGIIPITDVAWFSDDAANRFEQFIRTAWPEEHLEVNLTFVAESLDQKKGETSRDCIRRYLATGFYKHHLSMYKKRPIYWLFSSGKQRAFQCLVYLHRYNAGTLSRMRTEYVVKLQGKVNARIEQLESDIPSAGSTSHRKKLEKERDTLIKQREELQTFDEKLRHYADQRIELDLDDGVKVNYGKFGDLLAEVKAITGEKPEVVLS